MENKLLEIIKTSGLEESKTKVLTENFSDYYNIANEWAKKADMLVVTDISQVAEMKMAREGRLFLKDKRILIEKTRKGLKDSCLKEGKAIDEIARLLTQLIAPIEDDLESKEKFKERYEQKIKEELRLQRQNEVEQYIEFVPANIDLAELTDVAFKTVLHGAKVQYDAKLEEQRLQEEERLKQAKINEVRDTRLKELRNLDLWSFLDEEMKDLNFGTMSEKYYNGLVFDLKSRKEKKLQELEKIKNELADAQKERDRLNAELAKKEADAREKARLEQLEEEKARKEAAKLAKAPIKKQLKVWVDSFEISDCPVENETRDIIISKFEAFKNWAKKEIENL